MNNPNVNIDSYYDEESIKEKINTSPNPDATRKAINQIHEIMQEPLESIVLKFAQFHETLKLMNTDNPNNSLAKKKTRFLCESLIGGVILSSMHTLNISPEKMREIMGEVIISYNNIKKQREEEEKNG